MRRRARSILAAASLLIGRTGGRTRRPGTAGGGDGGDGLSVWHAEVTKAQVPLSSRPARTAMN